MPVTVDQLIASGAIRFFNFVPGVPVDINADELTNANSNQTRDDIIAALQVLEASTAIQNEIFAEISATQSLWIFVDQFGGSMSGAFATDPAENRLGIVAASSSIQSAIVRSDGVVESVSLARALAHELAHGVLGQKDTLEDLSGAASDPDYLGDVVRFENRVVADIPSLGSPRLAYAGAGPIDLLGYPIDGLATNYKDWTEGNDQVDLVLVNRPNEVKNGQLVNTGPGTDVNTSLNTVKLRDLIIADDTEAQDNRFTTGAGNDYIYAGKGKDVIDAGADDDHVYGGDGDDIVRWSLGNDSLFGGADNYAPPVPGAPFNYGDVLYLGSVLENLQFTVVMPRQNGIDAVMTVSPIGGGWVHQFTDFEFIIVGCVEYIVTDEFDAFVVEDITIMSEDSKCAISFENQTQGLKVDLANGYFSTLTNLQDVAYLKDFSAVTGGASSDELLGNSRANQIIGGIGNDTIKSGDGLDSVYGGIGNDYIEGDAEVDGSFVGGFHDDIGGGLGSDTVYGGSGADFLYDAGADKALVDGGNEADYANSTLIYDHTGNDELYGGAGADILTFSGGNDTFYGGAGDDRYEFVERVLGSTSPSEDMLTIVLAETSSDPTTFFGHDYIEQNAYGAGADLVIFQGISRSEVTIKYDFETFAVGSQVINFNPLFGLFFDPAATVLTQYVTVGTFQIVVNATGSSLTIGNVWGSYFLDNNGVGVFGREASISLPFAVQFADTLLNAASGALLDPATQYYSLLGTPLTADALDAISLDGTGVSAFDYERDIISETKTGTNGDDNLLGNNGAEGLFGGTGNDGLYGGRRNDLLDGGTGADTLDGGSGFDTVTYASSTSAVSVRLFDNSFRSGDAVGDVFISIENVVGTAFNDLIGGTTDNNILDGGAGNDTVFGVSGNDKLFGGLGNDSLDARNGGNNILGGGDGNDTVLSFGGQDTITGGNGDDLIYTGGFTVSFFPQTIVWGDDQIDGGAGTDTVVFEYNLGNQVIDMISGSAVFGTTGTIIKFVDIENVTANSGADTI